jgi:hypothetical protein
MCAFSTCGGSSYGLNSWLAQDWSVYKQRRPLPTSPRCWPGRESIRRSAGWNRAALLYLEPRRKPPHRGSWSTSRGAHRAGHHEPHERTRNGFAGRVTSCLAASCSTSCSNPAKERYKSGPDTCRTLNNGTEIDRSRGFWTGCLRVRDREAPGSNPGPPTSF